MEYKTHEKEIECCLWKICRQGNEDFACVCVCTLANVCESERVGERE